MTCRRKKIKVKLRPLALDNKTSRLTPMQCSGEINCRTCREKGLVCEGLPERKRPRRDGNSIVLDPVPSGGIERKRRISSTKRASLKRPSLSALKQSTSTGSEDSGYASTQADLGEAVLSPATSQPTDVALDLQPLSDSKLEGTRSSHSSMPAGLRVDTWRLEPNPARHDSDTNFDLSFLRPPSEVSPGAQPASAVLDQSPVDWSQIKDNEPWWTDTADNAPSLISTARALEEQAQSLRLMATQQLQQHNANDAQNALSRRQTVAFPLPSESEFDGRYDMLQNRTL